MNKAELEIKNMLRELKKIGIDTLEYEQELESLISLNTNSNHLSEQAMLKTGKTLRITELNAKISVYSSYLELYKILEYLEKGEPTLEERIELCMHILLVIGSKDEKIMSSNQLLKRAYTLIFDTIKQELKETLYSKIFDIVVTSDYDKLYLGEIVREEIERIKESTFVINLDYLDSLIKEEIKSNMSSPSNYVTLSLITKIVKCESGDELKETIDRTLQDTFPKLTDRNAMLNESLNGDVIKRKFLDTISELLDDIENYKIDIMGRFISGVLTTSLIFGVGIGGTRQLKKWLTKEYYETTKVTTVMDETIHEPRVDTYYDTLVEEKDRLLLEVDEKALLKGTLDEPYIRVYSIYYLKDVIKETDLEYLTIDLESPGIVLKRKYYTREEANEYSGEIKKLYRITQGETPEYSEYSKGWHRFLCTVLYVALFASSFIPYFPINDIIKILDDLKKSEEKEDLYNSLGSELKDLLNECMRVINKSDELISIYNKVLESGVLEKDTDDLTQDINNLIFQIKAKEQMIYKSQTELSELEAHFLRLNKD